MATTDQLPFRTRQVSVCEPSPEVDATQMPCDVGAAGLDVPPTLSYSARNGSTLKSVSSECDTFARYAFTSLSRAIPTKTGWPVVLVALMRTRATSLSTPEGRPS